MPKRGGVISRTLTNSVRAPVVKLGIWNGHRQPFFGRGVDGGLPPNLRLQKRPYSETDNRKLLLSTIPKTKSGFFKTQLGTKQRMLLRSIVV